MNRFVLALIDEIIPHESFLIVGESYGGYLARAVIRERPAAVEGMLLITLVNEWLDRVRSNLRHG
jgi:pimeloyl-ACP methyl ester carboxylesterase